jgi:predicted DNA binding CopG/RHH family protein
MTEKTKILTFRVPEQLLTIIDGRARLAGMDRSNFLRSLIMADLVKLGLLLEAKKQ